MNDEQTVDRRRTSTSSTPIAKIAYRIVVKEEKQIE
jgi:hypothetical protein